MKQQTKSKSSKFHLTPEETGNLIGREKFRGYVNDLIDRDIQMYLYTTILPRLNIPPNQSVTLSKDKEWLELSNEIRTNKNSG